MRKHANILRAIALIARKDACAPSKAVRAASKRKDGNAQLGAQASLPASVRKHANILRAIALTARKDACAPNDAVRIMADQDNLRPDGWHSRGYLPHYDGGETSQTVTFRLSDSLPQKILERWREELAHEPVLTMETALRKRIECYLDQGYGSCYLKEPGIAALVQDALLHYDGVRYRLTAWVVMPNHVHVLLTPCAGRKLSRIMHSIKSYTAQEANKRLNRKGRFWMKESFDRRIRNAEHFAAAVAYIENNPVKAGLCKKPEVWSYSSAWFKARR